MELSLIVLLLSMNGSDGAMNVRVTPSPVRQTAPARG